MSLLFPEVKVDEKATSARVKREFKDYHVKKATLETLENVSPLHFARGIKQPTMSTKATAPISDADLIRGGHVSNTGQDLTMLTERMAKHQDRYARFTSMRTNGLFANLLRNISHVNPFYDDILEVERTRSPNDS